MTTARQAPSATDQAPGFETAIDAFRSGDLATVRQICTVLVRQGRRDAGVLHLLGVALAEAGETLSAEQALRGALMLDPGLAEALLDHAALLDRIGAPAGAAEWQARGARLHPPLVGLHAGRLAASAVRQAERLRGSGDLHGAHRLARDVLRRTPDDAPALSVMAEIAFARDNLPLARHFAASAVRAGPGTLPARRLQALLAWAAGDLDAARRAFRALTLLAPDDAQGWYGLGLIAKATNDRPGARIGLGRAARLGWKAAVGALRDLDRTAPPTRAGARRIALFLVEPFHASILAPIERVAAARHRLLLTADPIELRRFRPEAVVLADLPKADLRRYAGDALLVYTRHGLADKGFGYFAAAAFDRVCVSSPEIARRYRQEGHLPSEMIWVTGYPQLDPLFRGDLPDPGLDLDRSRPVVLFAPTWTPTLSAAPMLGSDLVSLLRGADTGTQIVIKPHPHCYRRQPDWMTWWRAAAREPGVTLIEDPEADLVPLLAAADLLVSDTSSAIFQYLATDRPILLLTNPASRTDRRWYDPEAIEWRWRDIGQELHDPARLAAAVAAALAGPQAGAERRAHYRQRLFGTLDDGRAGERIVAAIEASLDG